MYPNRKGGVPKPKTVCNIVKLRHLKLSDLIKKTVISVLNSFYAFLKLIYNLGLAFMALMAFFGAALRLFCFLNSTVACFTKSSFFFFACSFFSVAS